MKKLLLFLLLPVLSFGQVQIGDDIDGEAAGDSFGFDIDISLDGNFVCIGAVGNNSGYVKVYENQNDNWIQVDENIIGLNDGDFFGDGVRISDDGSKIAISAPMNNVNGLTSGQIIIYENLNENWTQVGNTIDGNFSEFIGTEIALSSNGNIVAFNVDKEPQENNIVKVYQLVNDNWQQLGQDIIGSELGELFGAGLDISDDGLTLAIGAQGNNGFTGVVGVYEFINDSWILKGDEILGTNTSTNFGVGLSLNSNGNILAIGSPNSDNNGEDTGSTIVYQFINSDWEQLGNNIINGEASFDRSGGLNKISISSNGEVLGISSQSNDDNGGSSGHARIYKLVDNTWIQVGMDIDGEASFDLFGRVISLSPDGNFVAVSATENDGNGPNAGHVRVFDLSDILSTTESAITNFTLYPNPTKNSITLSLSNSEILQKTVIYNSLGQEVLNSTQTIIDVSSLSKGVYVVEVETATGKGSEKLIIN